jgi:hypothetical protein
MANGRKPPRHVRFQGGYHMPRLPNQRVGEKTKGRKQLIRMSALGQERTLSLSIAIG